MMGHANNPRATHTHPAPARSPHPARPRPLAQASDPSLPEQAGSRSSFPRSGAHESRPRLSRQVPPSEPQSDLNQQHWQWRVYTPVSSLSIGQPTPHFQKGSWCGAWARDQLPASAAPSCLKMDESSRCWMSGRAWLVLRATTGWRLGGFGLFKRTSASASSLWPVPVQNG